MALPLPYRPKAVNDLIEEEKRTALTMTLSKKELFMAAMFTWYSKLNKKEKSVLTKKKLIRRTLTEAHRLQLPYKALPSDWMSRMVKECGLVCYITKGSLARRQFREATAMVADTEMPEVTPSKNADNDEVKKFIDLTDEEPPEAWKAAKEAGKALPRYLTVGSTETSNILYWDYDASHWKVNGDVKSTSEPGKVLSGSDKGLLYNYWEN